VVSQVNQYHYLDATGAGLEDALTAAQTRIAELEATLVKVRQERDIALRWVRAAENIGKAAGYEHAETESNPEHFEKSVITALQAKLAGLAGEAVEFAKFVKAEIESLPIGFKQTIVVAVDGKHQVRSLLDLLERVDGFIHDHAAADLVADAVGERCEENTNRENDDG
jgi:Cu/Ag efflux pump CusA